MTTTLAILIASMGTVLVLPWSLKTSNIWSKRIRKWYSYLLAGLVVGMVALGLRIYISGSIESLVGTAAIYPYYSYLELLFETIAAILGAVGFLGIIYEVWGQK